MISPIRPHPAAAESIQGGINAGRRSSGRFQELIRISARNEGDMRGWFQFILGARAEPDPPSAGDSRKSG